MINQALDNRFVYVAGERSTSVAYLSSLLSDKANINAQDANGDTALHRAVRISNFKTVTFLVEKYSDLTLQNKNNFTAYDIALKIGDPKIIDVLYIPTKAALATDLDLFFLHSCKIGNISGVIESLAKGADITACNHNGVTALHYAAIYIQPKVVDLLIENKINVNILDKNGTSVLNYALMNNRPQVNYIICKLIKSGINYNIYGDKNDFSILYKLAYRGYYEAIMLMNNITNINELSEDEHSTALHIAAAMNNFNTVCVLLAKGANTGLKNKAKLNPYEVAMQLEYFNISDAINNPQTKFMQATIKGNIKSVRYWIDRFKTADVKYFFSQTPLNLAIQYNQTEIVKILLENKAQPTINEFNEHPLKLSANNHNCNITNMLVTNFITHRYNFIIDQNIYDHIIFECHLTYHEKYLKFLGIINVEVAEF